MYGDVSAKLQAGREIHEGLTAQKYIEATRAHVEPHVDNLALVDSTVLMRDGGNSYSKENSKDVLANATSILLPDKNSAVSIITNLW